MMPMPKLSLEEIKKNAIHKMNDYQAFIVNNFNPKDKKNWPALASFFIQTFSIIDGRDISATLKQNALFLIYAEMADRYVKSLDQEKAPEQLETLNNVVGGEDSVYANMGLRDSEQILQPNDPNFSEKFFETIQYINDNMSVTSVVGLRLLAVNIFWKLLDGPAPFSAESTNTFVNRHLSIDTQALRQAQSNILYSGLDGGFIVAAPMLKSVLHVALIEKNKISDREMMGKLFYSGFEGLMFSLFYLATHQLIVMAAETERPFKYNTPEHNQAFIESFNNQTTREERLNNGGKLVCAQEGDLYSDMNSGHTEYTAAMGLQVVSLGMVLFQHKHPLSKLLGLICMIAGSVVGPMEGALRNEGDAHTFGATTIGVSVAPISNLLAEATMLWMYLMCTKPEYRNSAAQWCKNMAEVMKYCIDHPKLAAAALSGFVVGMSASVAGMHKNQFATPRVAPPASTVITLGFDNAIRSPLVDVKNQKIQENNDSTGTTPRNLIEDFNGSAFSS